MKKAIRPVVCVAVLLFCAVGVRAAQLEITTDVRMRSEPHISGITVGVVPKDAIVPLIDQRGGWYKVQYNRVEGWIASDYATLVQSKAGEMFTKQDVSVPPPDLETVEAPPRATKYARVLKDNTMILEYVDPQAPFIHKARRGDVFPLVGEGGTSFSMVVCKDTTGWVRNSNIEILDEKPTTSIAVNEAINWFAALLVCSALAFAAFGFVTYRHIKAERKRNIYVQKNALILAKESKPVQYMLTNAVATMEHCFTEIGFSVSVAKDSVVARNSIEHSMPDLILADWNFEPSIFVKIDNLFARMPQQAVSPYFIFYNVSDPSAVPPAKALRNVSFLGLNVSDRDIFKVVTPLIVQAEAEQSPKELQKGLQRCALEGEIAGGNLLEVFQFIEIGSKTGCLMVETRGPFGLVYFGDGRIIYAAAEGGQGVEAVYAILNQPSGKFRFITNKAPKIANMNLPTLSVLMEWTKEKDEARRV